MAVAWSARDVADPQVLAVNEALAAELGLDAVWLRGAAGARFLVGNLLPEGASPVAQAYAGNQFGGPLSRLGDGRAMLLGEIVDRAGERHDVHLKGSGRTPFARGGDGLAAVGPMLREYVISEAMHALGIPTSRALGVVATRSVVRRESDLPGAVLTRVASSHLRVGSVQYASGVGDVALLRRLADHAIARHFPDAAGADRPYLAFYESVIAAQASLVARWMLVGFVHGVMNTDNMTLSGETIDYGPCAFMEAHDPATVFSSIDDRGRYAYGNQPQAAQWNLARLGEALLPLLHDDQEQAVADAVAAVDSFPARYRAAWLAGMRVKLGVPAEVEDAAAASLADDVLVLLHANHVDHTTFFRGLGVAARGGVDPVRDEFLDLAGHDAWIDRWRAVHPDADVMDRANPAYIPRNHLVEEALNAATEGDLSAFDQLVDVVTDPFTRRPGLERYEAAAPRDFGSYRTYCGT